VALCAVGDAVIALRWRRSGVTAERSTDGVRWEPMPLGRAAETLRRMAPLCPSADSSHALFCSDPDKAVRKVPLGPEAAPLGEPFHPTAQSAEWYETGEPLPDMTILRDEAAGDYRAFFTARRRAGRHPERRGCIGVARSPNLADWRADPPIFAPNLFPRLFAPHLLRHGGRVILFYATDEEGGIRALRAASAPAIEGPYEPLEPDILACDARRALHSAPLAGRRLAFFARPTPEHPDCEEFSRPATLEFTADGRPWFRYYNALTALAGRTIFQTEAALASGETLVRVIPRYGADVRLTARIANRNARAAGLLLRTSITGHDNLTVWLDFEAGAVALRRGVNGRLLARFRRAFEPECEHQVTVWAEGGYVDVYVDDAWLLAARTETRRSGGFGVVVRGGEARISDWTAQTLTTEGRP